jgi:tetratricopeptide (TPR) repeat protein
MARVGQFLGNDGKYNNGIQLLREVVKIRAAIGGADDWSTLISMNSLARTYTQQGKLTEAVQMYEEVLAKRKVILGEDHPDTLTSMPNLAWTYTLTCMNNLAEMYRQQGNFTEATQMHEEVIAKIKVILGDDQVRES